MNWIPPYLTVALPDQYFVFKSDSVTSTTAIRTSDVLYYLFRPIIFYLFFSFPITTINNIASHSDLCALLRFTNDLSFLRAARFREKKKL